MNRASPTSAAFKSALTFENVHLSTSAAARLSTCELLLTSQQSLRLPWEQHAELAASGPWLTIGVDDKEEDNGLVQIAKGIAKYKGECEKNAGKAKPDFGDVYLHIGQRGCSGWPNASSAAGRGIFSPQIGESRRVWATLHAEAGCALPQAGQQDEGEESSGSLFMCKSVSAGAHKMLRLTGKEKLDEHEFV